MDSSFAVIEDRSNSPDSSSHALNRHDTVDPEGEYLIGNFDDDIDFESFTDDSENVEFDDLPEDTEFNFQTDADDGLSGVEIEFSLGDSEDILQEDGNENEVESHEPQAQPIQPARPSVGRIQVSPSQMMQLLGHAGLRIPFIAHSASRSGASNVDDEDLEDGYGGLGTRRKRRSKGLKEKEKFPTIPDDDGRVLMNTGTFGENEYYKDILRKRKPLLATRLMRRELGIDRYSSTRTNRLISQSLIPSSNADTIIHYNQRCYSGQFSDDGNFFFSCAQDFKVRMYDTSNPYKWKYYKTVQYHYGQWTITDASLSPDNRHLAYSSIRSVVSLAPTDPSDTSEPVLLDFSNMNRRNNSRFNPGYSRFGIWSIRFSGDGREIVAGTSDHCVYVHDVEIQKSTLRIPGHSDDVNAVCFGDASSPHILYSGSDDTLIKVWDRRSMGDSREAGVFMGHTEGLTYVDSKGDGRYVLSNGKEQLMKLWDLRKMMPTDKASKVDPGRYGIGFDYRFMSYSASDYQPHPLDCSVVTFRGHRVLKTLIRCHFSPPASTNSRYVYSGSEDGSVYIYNMDATLAGKIDVEQATYHSRPRNPELDDHTYDLGGRGSHGGWKTCVRDASWHPNAPIVAATSWNGWNMSTGTCTTHSWNDGAKDDEAEPKMGLSVNERLQYDEELFENSRLRNRRTGQFRARLRSRQVAMAEEDEGD